MSHAKDPQAIYRPDANRLTHTCGEYRHGFNAALAVVRARLDAHYTEVRDAGTGELSRRDVLRLLTRIRESIADTQEQREQPSGRTRRRKAA